MAAGPSPVPIPSTPAPSWLGRNWKWFVPTGCLTLIVLFAAFVGCLLFFVMGMFRHSDVYQQALAKAQANSQVIQQLGQPIEAGWLISGQLNTTGASGHANLIVSISGPKNHGKLYIVADKSADLWKFTTLEVAVEGQPKRLDLLQVDKLEPVEQ